LWALLFGPIYFAVRGAWGAAVIQGIAIILAFSTGPFVLFLLPPVWLAGAIVANGVLRRRYLRMGWRPAG
jgi:hypothetical protein